MSQSEPLTRRTAPAGAGRIAMVGACFGVALGAVALAMTRAEERLEASADPIVVSTTAPVWRVAAARSASFDLDAPRWRALGFEAAHWRRTDGATRDLFRFGELAGERRHALVTIDRGDIGARGESADEALQGLAADIGVRFRVAPAHGALDTKFGPLATADMAFEDDRTLKACLGFAFRDGAARVRISGWVCSPGPELVDRREASCFLDRLVTVGLGDPALARLFAQAELRRQTCPQPQTAQGIAPAPVPSEVVGRLRPRAGG